MSEADLQRRIQRALEARGAVVMKHHASQFTGRGWPDLWVALPGGRLACLETKTPVGRRSKIQARKLDRLRATGSIAEFVTSVSEALEVCGLGV